MIYILFPVPPFVPDRDWKDKKRVTDKDWQQLLYFRSRSEFVTTQTLERAMQAAAIIGFRRNPVKG